MAKLECTKYGQPNSITSLNFWLCVHPDEKDIYFNSISKSINAVLSEKASTRSWSLWYDEEPLADYDEESLLSHLSQMKALIVVITKKFLSTANRALSVEFKYAVANKTPILPLMMEEGLDVLFTKKCGSIQYLLPSDSSYTSITYSTKLRNFLSSLFIDNKLYSRILKEFDATIFLSYRKIDRKHAQELMEIIHRNEAFRDVAIWYDEFLTPGENYNDLIADEIKKSRAFVMAVTRNTTDSSVNAMGEPCENYIVTHEYPSAVESDIPIIPVLSDFDSEIIKFNLKWKFPDIPDCIPIEEANLIYLALRKALDGVPLGIRRGIPEHDYLIGLAYLTGTRVETDKQMAVKLITSAAEAGHVEAINSIAKIYETGNGVVQDIHKSIDWNLKILEYHKKELNDPQTALDSVVIKYCLNLCLKQIEIISLMCIIYRVYDRIEDLISELHELSEQFKDTVYKPAIDAGLQNIYYLQARHAPFEDERKKEYCICAYENAEKLMSSQESQSNLFNFSQSAYALALYYNTNRNIEKALDYLLRAEEAAKKAMHMQGNDKSPILIQSDSPKYSDMCKHYCTCAYLSAELLLKQKRLEDAEYYFDKAQAAAASLSEKSKTMDRPNLKFCAYLMNYALFEKNYDKAKEYHRRISRILDNMTDNNPDSFEVYELLGIYRETVGDYSGAERLYLKALNNSERSVERMKPENYVDTVQLLTLLSVLFKRSGSHTLSESYALRANEFRKLFAASYPDKSLCDMLGSRIENIFYLPDGVADALTREEEKKNSAFSSDTAIYKSAENYLKLAERHLSVGNIAPARQNFLKAIEILEGLCVDCPDEAVYTDALDRARAHLEIAENPPVPTENHDKPKSGGVLSRLFRRKKE